MALYMYQAFSRDGKKIKGQLDAPSPGGARELLQRKGLLPISILPAAQAAKKESFFQRIFSRSVPLKEKILFTKQLAVLLKAGIPLLAAVELLQDQFEGKLHRVLVTLKDGLKEGQSLADGMQQYPHIFENIYVQLVRAGEASGRLEVILERLTQFLERRDEIQKKVGSALRGPIIQLAMIGVVVVGLMVSVVPQLAGTFTSQGAALPLPTQILMAASDFLVYHYVLLLILSIGFWLSFSYWSSTPSGALLIDRIKLRLPIVSLFTRIGAVVQFSKTLGMLLEGGVNLSQALTIVCSIVDNRVLKKALEEAREKIVKEGKIAEYLKQTGMFPPMATYLIRTGEESGALDTMLLNVGRTSEEELSELADTLTTLLNPIITVLMAVVVGFIVVAIASPIMKMGSLVQ
ncbi:MAG: type II secretory pathway component PulF [Alteromonas naphthalenivorans]|jgi:type II secretory pathway component PulF